VTGCLSFHVGDLFCGCFGFFGCCFLGRPAGRTWCYTPFVLCCYCRFWCRRVIAKKFPRLATAAVVVFPTFYAWELSLSRKFNEVNYIRMFVEELQLLRVCSAMKPGWGIRTSSHVFVLLGDALMSVAHNFRASFGAQNLSLGPSLAPLQAYRKGSRQAPLSDVPSYSPEWPGGIAFTMSLGCACVSVVCMWNQF